MTILHILVGDGHLVKVPPDIVAIRLITRADGKDYSVPAKWYGGSSILRFQHTIHIPVGNSLDCNGTIRIDFHLLGETMNSKERLLGKVVFITSKIENSITKVFLLNDINGNLTSRLSATFLAYKFQMDLSHSTLLQDDVVQEIEHDIPQLDSKEYAFLLSRKLHWTKPCRAAFKVEMEEKLNADVTMHLKDIYKSIHDYKSNHSDGTRSKKTEYEQPLIKTAISPSKVSYSIDTRRRKTTSKSRSEPPKLRETNSSVGYLGVVWPKVTSNVKMAQVEYKLQLAEERKMTLMQKILKQRVKIQRTGNKEKLDTMMKLTSQNEKALNALLSNKLRRKEAELRELEKELHEQRLESILGPDAHNVVRGSTKQSVISTRYQNLTTSSVAARSSSRQRPSSASAANRKVSHYHSAVTSKDDSHSTTRSGANANRYGRRNTVASYKQHISSAVKTPPKGLSPYLRRDIPSSTGSSNSSSKRSPQFYTNADDSDDDSIDLQKLLARSHGVQQIIATEAEMRTKLRGSPTLSSSGRTTPSPSYAHSTNTRRIIDDAESQMNKYKYINERFASRVSPLARTTAGDDVVTKEAEDELTRLEQLVEEEKYESRDDNKGDSTAVEELSNSFVNGNSKGDSGNSNDDVSSSDDDC